MDTLAMHRTLTEAGFPPVQADAVVKVMQGGVVTKHDLDSAVAELHNEIGSLRIELKHEINALGIKLQSESKRLDGKIQLILIVAIIGVLAPAATRLILGS